MVIDITRLIVERTDIDEEARKLAKSICTGNERKSWLHKVTVSILPNELTVQFQVKLRNQQGWYVKNPVTGEMVRVGTAYSDTSTVKFTGFMGSSCAIQAYTVTSANAVYRLLGAFATLLVNSQPLQLVLVSEVCPLLQRRFDSSFIQISDEDLALTEEELFQYSAEDCLEAFQDINRDVVECTVPIFLTDSGKEHIRRKTFGVIVDAECDFRFSVKRSEIPGWFDEDLIRVPEQHIICRLITSGDAIEISFTISPTIWINGNQAVRASVNMDDVVGVPSYIGNILKEIVNSNDQLNNGLVDFVNESGILG
jgi:hypothetical protein